MTLLETPMLSKGTLRPIDVRDVIQCRADLAQWWVLEGDRIVHAGQTTVESGKLVNQEDIDAVLKGVYRHLTVAPGFVVTDEICQIVDSLLEQVPITPLHRDEIFAEAGFALFQRPFVISVPPSKALDRDFTKIVIGGMSWDTFSMGTAIVLYTIEPGSAPHTFIYGPWSISSWMFGEDKPVGSDDHIVSALFLAFQTFIAERIVAQTEERPDRAERRRLERTYGTERSQEWVRVVHLRRAEYERANVDDGEGRKYSCQWLVSGHIRAQWYPSQRVFKRKYIAPYVKGPLGAPFKKPAQKIYRVDR